RRGNWLALPLLLGSGLWNGWRSLSGSRSRCLRSATALRRRRWGRRRWRKRFQIVQSLRARAQLAVEQKNENIFGNLRICRELGRNQQFGHLRKWDLLLHLAPLGKEIFNLQRNCLLTRSN